MTQKLLLLSCAIFGGQVLSAQPILQNTVFPAIGDQYTLILADTTGVHQGDAGANQQWNFSNLDPVDTVGRVQYVSANGTPYLADYPQANLSAYIIDGIDTTYAYYRVEASRWSYLGQGQYGIPLVYTDPELLLQAPLNYLAGFTDDLARYHFMPDNSLQGAGEKTAFYDAYGTLTTPAGTFPNAMRLYTIIAYQDTIWQFAGYAVNEHTDYTYEWYVANRPGPQLTIFYSSGQTKTYVASLPPMTTINPFIKEVRYVNGATSATDEPSRQLTGITAVLLSPNPAADVLHCQFESLTSGRMLSVSLLDAQGRRLRTQALETQAGPNRISFPVADLPAGAYYLTLSDGRSVRTQPWQKQ